MTNPGDMAAANRRGIIAMVTAQAFFIVNDSLMKLATAIVPSTQAIAIRGGVAVALMLVWVVSTGHATMLRMAWSPLVMLRGVLEALVAIAYIAALSYMPIADVTAIFLISPLLITAMSVVFFGESVGWRRWLAVVVGFCGMLLVVKPGGSDIGWPALLVIASAIGAAARDLVTRRIDPAIPTSVVTLNTTVMVTLVAILALPLQGVTAPDARALALLSCAAAVVVVGNFMIIRAFRGVEISAVSPFRFMIMVWAIAAGVLVFGDWPDPLAIVGIALIVGAGLYTMHREAARARAA